MSAVGTSTTGADTSTAATKTMSSTTVQTTSGVINQTKMSTASEKTTTATSTPTTVTTTPRRMSTLKTELKHVMFIPINSFYEVLFGFSVCQFSARISISLVRYMLPPVRFSVCLSVTRAYQSKIVWIYDHAIVSYSSPPSIVFMG